VAKICKNIVRCLQGLTEVTRDTADQHRTLLSGLSALCLHADTFVLTTRHNNTFELYLNDPKMQTVNETVIRGVYIVALAGQPLTGTES